MKKQIFLSSNLTLSSIHLKMLLLLLGTLSGLNVTAQNCSTANITLSTQTEVDNFQTTYGPCTTITGSIIIMDDNDGTDDIVNLNGLSSVSSIGQSLLLTFNNNLTSVNGLSNLNSVGASLVVQTNSSLTNLDGFSNITSLLGGLDVQNNNSLTSIDGLSNIASVGGIFLVKNNSVLTNVDGLSGLNSVGGGLDISSNNSLTNMNGLSNLNSIGGDLFIQSNSSLANINGFSNLNSIGGSLNIFNNSVLTNLNGLSNVASIGVNLSITNNAQLAECCGLYPVLMGGGGGVGNLTILLGNLSTGNCNNHGADVTAACPTVPTLSEWGLLNLALLLMICGVLYLLEGNSAKQNLLSVSQIGCKIKNRASYSPML